MHVCVAQDANLDGVRDVTWYSQLHHLQNGIFSAFASKQGWDIGTTVTTANSIVKKVSVLLECLENGVVQDPADGTVWDAGALRVEVRAVVNVGRPLHISDVQTQLGPWLSIATQEAKLQQYVDVSGAVGLIAIRKLEFSTAIVRRQASICLFLLQKCISHKSPGTKLSNKARFLLLLLTSSVGYSNPRWYRTFLTLAAQPAQRLILQQVHDAIYRSSPTRAPALSQVCPYCLMVYAVALKIICNCAWYPGYRNGTGSGS
jgi:hypothetical protein